MSKTKTNWKKTFNKDYLGSHDLDDGAGNYSDLKLTIQNVIMKVVKDPQGNDEGVRIANFVEKAKPMILNVGHCEQIEAFTGSRYIDDWGNCVIQVYVKSGVKAFGSVVDALRIRPQQPRTEFPVLDENHERFGALCQAYAEKGDAALTAARKGYTISDETVEVIKSRAEDLKGEG